MITVMLGADYSPVPPEGIVSQQLLNNRKMSVGDDPDGFTTNTQ